MRDYLHTRISDFSEKVCSFFHTSGQVEFFSPHRLYVFFEHVIFVTAFVEVLFPSQLTECVKSIIYLWVPVVYCVRLT